LGVGPKVLWGCDQVKEVVIVMEVVPKIVEVVPKVG